MIINGQESRPANAEMIEGFRDGYDLSVPEPSSDRSESYWSGFIIGRMEKTVFTDDFLHRWSLEIMDGFNLGCVGSSRQRKLQSELRNLLNEDC